MQLCRSLLVLPHQGLAVRLRPVHGVANRRTLNQNHVVLSALALHCSFARTRVHKGSRRLPVTSRLLMAAASISLSIVVPTSDSVPNGVIAAALADADVAVEERPAQSPGADFHVAVKRFLTDTLGSEVDAQSEFEVLEESFDRTASLEYKDFRFHVLRDKAQAGAPATLFGNLFGHGSITDALVSQQKMLMLDWDDVVNTTDDQPTEVTALFDSLQQLLSTQPYVILYVSGSLDIGSDGSAWVGPSLPRCPSGNHWVHGCRALGIASKASDKESTPVVEEIRVEVECSLDQPPYILCPALASVRALRDGVSQSQ